MHIAAQALHGGYTIEDILALPRTRNRHELIDGSLVVTPAPDLVHRRAAQRLSWLLGKAAPQGVTAGRELSIRIGGELLTPDVVVGRSLCVFDNPVVDPDDVILVAMVVSAGGGRLDRKWKPQVYAEAGITTLLEVELARTPSLLQPSEGGPSPLRVMVFRLEDGHYVAVADAAAGQTLALTEPFPVGFDPAVLA